MKKSYELFLELIQERGLSTYAVAMRSGVPQSAFSLWKNHGVIPKFERMAKIAAALSTPERPIHAVDFYSKEYNWEGGRK